MRKKYLLFAFLVIATTVVFADDRSEQQMRDAAVKALRQKVSRRAAGGDLKEFLSMPKLKIYGYEEGGFVVIAKDDRYAEILGSSSTNYVEGMPCGFKWWLETSNEAMEKNCEQNPASSQTKKTIRRASVGPLISTKWGQSKPYNNKCKIVVDGVEYSLLTGCVATAMAQVMNYYKHPAKGKGENRYSLTYSDWGEQVYYSNFDSSYYDWNNMLDDYSAYWYSNTENQYTDAVALLMSDCGKAVNMRYTTLLSGAFTYSIPIALNKNFSYSFLDETNTIYNRSDYSNEEWMTLIYNALNNNHPVLYRGANGTGGHMFVIHGYDSDGGVLVNWGWDGSFDGTFMIDMLTPGSYSFNDFQQMIIPIPESETIDPVYKLSYVVDGNIYKEYELKAGDTITPEPEPTKSGYIFSGWSTIPTIMPANNVTITGTFTKGAYKLVYKIDGKVYKTVSYDLGASIIPEPAPEKEGYTFAGWSNIPTTMPAYDVIVTGSFTINKYKLTYIVDGVIYRSYNLEYGANIIPEAEPTKDGYSFSGWSSVPSTMPSHNVTITGEFLYNHPSANILTTEIDGIYYNLIGKSRTAEVIKSPNKYSGSVTIPESVEYEGFAYQVTRIGEYAFAACAVTSVSIPASVTGIDKLAFYQSELASVSIPSSVTMIGDCAFQECFKLSSIVLPNSIENYGIYVFSGCKNLVSVTLPDGLTIIPSAMFAHCTGLASIKIPETVTSINYSAFEGCSALESISLPQNLTHIEYSSFKNCENLSSIVVPDQVTSISSSAFMGCASLTTATIGKSVKNIYSKAFSTCKSLESVICMADIPPTTEADIFENSYIEYATLYVPENSVNLYSSQTPWSEFGKIISNNTSIDCNNIYSKDSKYEIYDLNGNVVKSLKPVGVAIIKIGDKSIKVAIK